MNQVNRRVSQNKKIRNLLRRDLDERLALLLPTLITREVKESLIVDEVTKYFR